MTSKPSSLLLTLAASMLAVALSGCAAAVIGGVAAGAMLVTDRRTAGSVVDDERIELRGAGALRDTFGDRAHFNVASYNRQVLLTGEVPNEAAKQQAEQIVSRVENVRGIVNELAVAGNTSLAQRSNDTLITGKVKASLVDAFELQQVNAFKVVTERGTVYLMGRVTHKEADKATQVARTVGGVQRVVRIFDYVGDAPAPAAVATPLPPASAASAPR